ncbi:MAG: hypothetical protein AB1777_00945 [Bacteroidota bacterium]
MSTKKILLVSLIVAGGVGILHLLQWYRDYRQSNFSLKGSSITAIELIKGTDTLRLTNSEGIWLINGFYLADSATVSSFIDILRNINAVAPATLKTADDLLLLFQEKAIRVCIYNKSLKKEYRIASVAEFNYKPVALTVGSETPYYVESPIASIDLIEYFSVNPDSWLASKLFVESPEEIACIKVDFPNNNKGYTIKFTENDIVLLSVNGNRLSNINLANISNLYYSFGDLKLRYPNKSEVISAKPENLIAVLQLQMANRKTYEYKIFRIVGEGYTNILGQKLEYNPNRILIKLAENHFLVGTYTHFHYMLSPIDEFVNNYEK